jgi:hypothetical protein
VAGDPTKWPFLGIQDVHGRDLGWCGFAGPPRYDAHSANYEALARHKYRFIGWCSHGEFPNGIGETYPCEAWCHCFRDPDARLPSRVPRILLSESDFADASAIKRAREASSGAIASDYVCVSLAGWPEPVKNPQLAIRCVWALWRALGLKALFVVGKDSPSYDLPPGTEVRTYIPWGDLQASLAAARFSLFASQIDASPRLITETLCNNRPVVVNAALIGGWKYVTPDTGTFFTSEHDVVQAAALAMATARRPYAWFHERFGLHQAGRMLYDLLHRLDPRLPTGGEARIIRT